MTATSADQPARSAGRRASVGTVAALSSSAMASAFPEWVVPMAATLTQERFTGPDWIFERKLDGIRLLAFKQGAQVRLFSRNRLEQSCPAVAAALAGLPAHDAIFDGEVTWDGRAYHLFDVLWLDGRETMSLPLEQRRALLEALPLAPPLERVERVDDPQPWERAAREGWEGVIAKRRGSPYEHRRSPHWLKMKIEVIADLVVGGFTDPQGSRVGLGALLVGYFEGGDLVFAGKVGTGFDTRLLLDLRARLDALALPTSPFTRATGLPRLAHWARPEIDGEGRVHRMDHPPQAPPPPPPRRRPHPAAHRRVTATVQVRSGGSSSMIEAPWPSAPPVQRQRSWRRRRPSGRVSGRDWHSPDLKLPSAETCWYLMSRLPRASALARSVPKATAPPE